MKRYTWIGHLKSDSSTIGEIYWDSWCCEKVYLLTY